MAVVGPGAPRGWRIESGEAGIDIQCPYEARTSTVTFGLKNTITSATMSNAGSPFPVVSAPRRVNVTGTFHAEDNADSSLEPTVWDFERLATVDPGLRRRPLVELTVGSHVAIEGWLNDLTITWGEGSFDAPPFLPRSFTVQFSVVEASPLVVENSNAQGMEPSTRYLRLSAGETFESLAMDHYGDPYLGVRLRASNRQIDPTGERGGDVVMVYERRHSEILKTIEPQSAPFYGHYHTHLQAVGQDRAQRTGMSIDAVRAVLELV